MNETEQKAVAAIAAIHELNLLHKQFIADLKIAAQRPSRAGTLAVLEDGISCECHGHKLAETHRPVFVNGEIVALEYNFVTTWQKEDISIFCLYLRRGGFLTLDASGEKKLCDYNNTYSSNRILEALWEALFKSPVFSPIVI